MPSSRRWLASLQQLLTHVFSPRYGEIRATRRGPTSPRRSTPPTGASDFVDALDAILRRDANLSFFDTVTGFARWRWFTASRDVGRHFEEGAALPEDAMVPVLASLAADAPAGARIESDVMLLGSRYIELHPTTQNEATRTLRFEASTDVVWVLDLIGGNDGTDGQRLDRSDGVFSVSFTTGPQVMIVTALPVGEDTFDADDITDQRYQFSLTVD